MFLDECDFSAFESRAEVPHEIITMVAAAGRSVPLPEPGEFRLGRSARDALRKRTRGGFVDEFQRFAAATERAAEHSAVLAATVNRVLHEGYARQAALYIEAIERARLSADGIDVTGPGSISTRVHRSIIDHVRDQGDTKLEFSEYYPHHDVLSADFCDRHISGEWTRNDG